MVLIEQPEIHLHPKAQSGLADVFIDAIDKKNIQIILESHSEHLLRRIQRRIAEDYLKTDETNLYFCNNDGSKSNLQELQLDLFGNIKNWPEDFFGGQMQEIIAMNDAIIKRKN